MKADIKKILVENYSEKSFWDDLIYNKLWLLTKWYFAVVEPIQGHWCKFKRACSYFKHGYYSFDFDSAYLLDDMLFKLKRIQDNIINHGCHVVEKEEEQSLRLAIKLLKRQMEKSYGEYFRRLHDEKWGELDMKLEPHDRDEKGKILTYSSIFSRPNVKTPEDEEQERKEHRKIMELEEELKMRDRRWLFDIFQKHMDKWWD